MADEAKSGAETGEGDSQNPLYALVSEDVTQRSDWATKDEEILKRRLGKRKARKSNPFPGAANSVVPIVDDVVTEKTETEISMQLNAPTLAQFIAREPGVSVQEARLVEAAFNTYLLHMVEIRPKLEEALDTKNSRGFGLFKVFRTDHELWGMIPDADAIDPRTLIVPYNTRDLRTAERITHVLRFNERQLRERERERGWRNVSAVIQSSLSDERSNEKHGEADDLEVTAQLIGLTTSGEGAKEVVVWECWHYATAWDVAQSPNGEIVEGKKCCSVFSPDEPDLLLTIFPWREADVAVQRTDAELVAELEKMAPEALAAGQRPEPMKMQPGRDRPWPFVQARYENRTRWYHDSRGIGQLCMDDQIVATETQNAKLNMMSYYQRPLLQGGGGGNSGNVSFEPGSFLPEGVKFVEPPQIPASLDFTIESFKRSAARRGRASGQYEFSGQVEQSRKLQKTAEEVRTESARSNVLSSASIDRFNDPLRMLYQQLWDDLARMKKNLPVIAAGQFLGDMPSDKLYARRWMVVSAASAKTLNPELQFNRAQNALQYLAGFKDIVPIRFQEALQDVMSYWDPVRATQWIGDPSKPDGNLPPLYQVLQGLQQQISQLAQATKGLNEIVDNHDKVLLRVGKVAAQAATERQAVPANAAGAGAL